MAMTRLPLSWAAEAFPTIQLSVAEDNKPSVPESMPITTSPSMGSQA